MKWFKRKSEPVDPLATAKSRDEIIERLREMGFFIRRQNIRKPKVGDTVRFYVSAGWKINTWYYQTGVVTDISNTGDITVEKRKKNGALIALHYVHALNVIKVSKTKVAPTQQDKKG